MNDSFFSKMIMSRRTLMKAILFMGLSMFWPFRRSSGTEKKAQAASAKKHIKKSIVVRVSHNKATSWDYKTPPYTDFIYYDIVQTMLEEGLKTLSGAKDVSEAWKSIFNSYNAGDKIVIKPNFNNTDIGYAKAIMTSPQVIAAVLESLIYAGYPAHDIIVYDLTAKETNDILTWKYRFGVQTVFMPNSKNVVDKIIDGVKGKLFFGLHAGDKKARIAMREILHDDLGDSVSCYIPKIVTGAHHLINVPVFKAHQFVLQSSALKNHFGTVRFSNRNSYPVVLHGDKIEANIVDLNRNDHIRLKTRIIIADALFGAGCFTREGYGRIPTPWKTLSAGPTPNSLFFSFDPIALESVLADYIIQEQKANGFEPYSHEYLHDAMKAGLGIHEHREINGRYSKIEYKEILF